jgi:hypothetical protein
MPAAAQRLHARTERQNSECPCIPWVTGLVGFALPGIQLSPFNLQLCLAEIAADFRPKTRGRFDGHRGEGQLVSTFAVEQFTGTTKGALTTSPGALFFSPSFAWKRAIATLPGSSVAEQVTVNHLVAGSIPARAASDLRHCPRWLASTQGRRGCQTKPLCGLDDPSPGSHG